MDAGGDLVLVTGLPDPPHGLGVLVFRYLEGGRQPEGEREVAGTDVDAVEAGRRGYLVHPFEGLSRLDHDEAQDLTAELLGVSRPDHACRPHRPEGAYPPGRVAAGGDGARGLLGAVDEGHDHGPSAGV